MGTNYYAHFDDRRIHLTKTSAGWRLAIQLHGRKMGCRCQCQEHHYRNIEEFREFINREDVTIEDEYGSQIGAGEFMEKLELFNAENTLQPDPRDWEMYVELDGWIFHGGNWS